MSGRPPEARVAAAVISTLAPDGGGRRFTDADRARAAVPHAWQMRGAQSHWSEIHGVANGLPRGYVSDLLARAASGGELLVLAFAALMDAEQWLEANGDPTSVSRRSLVGRGLAEASGLWSLSAGHAAVNVAARVVCISEGALSLEKGSRTSLPTLFDQTLQANLSLNPKTIACVVAAAEQTGDRPARLRRATRAARREPSVEGASGTAARRIPPSASSNCDGWGACP